MVKIKLSKVSKLGFVLFLVMGILVGIVKRDFILKVVDRVGFRYEEIEAKSLFVGEKKEGTFAPPISADQNGVTFPKGLKGEIFLNFSQPIPFDSFSLFFGGNLHLVSSFLAEDFDVYYKDNLGQWNRIVEVKGNRSSAYRFYSPTTISTDSMKISISKVPFADVTAFNDLKFYKKTKVGLLEGIKYFFYDQRKSLPAYLFYSFLFYFFLLFPGYVILDLIGRKRNSFLDIEWKTVLAPLVTIVILFFIALFYLLIGDPNILSSCWLIFILSLLVFLKRRLDKEVFSAKFILFLVGTVLLISFFIQAQRDYLFNLQYIEQYLDKLELVPVGLRGGYYGYHGDNTVQWRIAKLFLHKIPIDGDLTKDYLSDFSPEIIFDRTPLLPMISMVILRLFGESHFVYQRFLNVLAALYYSGVYLLLRTYFSKGAAKITSVLLLLNVLLTFCVFNVEIFYKYFAIFPVLLAFALFFKEKNRNPFLIGILIGVGFLIHPMTLFYDAVLFLLYFLRYKLTMQFFKKITVVFSILLFLFAGWVLVSQHLKSEAGIEAKNQYLAKVTAVNEQVVENKLANLLAFLAPNPLLKNPGGGVIRLFSRDFWIPVLNFSLISNLTPAMFILLIIYLSKNRKKNYEILLMAVVPLLIYVFFYPIYAYGRFYILYPFAIPCFLGYITNWLIKEKKAVRLIVFGSYSFFMLINLYYIAEFFTKMGNTSLVVLCLSWAKILSFGLLSLLLIKMGADNNGEGNVQNNI